MVRSLARGVVSFGLVSIPVEIYPSVEDHSIHFHMLHKKCGTRIQNQRICPACKVVVERADLVRGFQVSKDQYIQVTDEELDALKAEGDNAIALEQFIPLETVDPLFFESSYYLAPDKGAAKPYQLLAETMKKTGRAALAQMVFHDKESLVLLRPFERGLVLHFLYYQNEIRDFSQIGKGEGEKLSSDEIDLAKNLIEQMSSAEFDPERYEDEYGKRAQSMIEEKVKGHEIKAAPKAPERGAKVIDIMAALKQSLAETKSKRPARATSKEKKRKAGS